MKVLFPIRKNQWSQFLKKFKKISLLKVCLHKTPCFMEGFDTQLLTGLQLLQSFIPDEFAQELGFLKISGHYILP